MIEECLKCKPSKEAVERKRTVGYMLLTFAYSVFILIGIGYLCLPYIRLMAFANRQEVEDALNGFKPVQSEDPVRWAYSNCYWSLTEDGVQVCDAKPVV